MATIVVDATQRLREMCHEREHDCADVVDIYKVTILLNNVLNTLSEMSEPLFW